MTRQKKEIIRKIDEIERFIEVDMELGCGFAPAGFYEPMEKEAWELREQLAGLSHYASVEEMLYDRRGCGAAAAELPFM